MRVGYVARRGNEISLENRETETRETRTVQGVPSEEETRKKKMEERCTLTRLCR